jgi:hypothetical protein
MHFSLSLILRSRFRHPAETAGYVACAALAWATWTSEVAADPSQLVPEVGYNYGEVETGRSAAMGGALRALGNAVTGLYLNPANIALTRAAHMQAIAQIWPQASRQSYGASIVDSVTGRLAAGVGGHYNVLDPSGVDRKWTDARLALAFPLSDKFYVGATGKYLKLRENGGSAPKFGLPASPASGGLDQEPIVDGLTFDLGLTVKPSNQLLIGLLGSNLTSPGNGYQPTSLGGGVGIGTDDMTIEGDVVADFTTFTKADGASRTTMRAMAGFEYLAADHYPLRLGYRYDQGFGTHGISAGLGYIETMFSVDLAVRHTFGNDGYAPVTTIVIDLQYFLESTGIRGGGGGD